VAHPELLARHCTEAGLIEKAAGLWGKAGGRSLDRSALVEAIEHFKRALDQIAMLPPTPALRRREIKVQVALLNPLVHVKGYAAPETKAAAERARVLIEQADALGEPPKDPMLLFQVLSIIWNANFTAFNCDVMRELATQFLALAESQGAALPRMMGHRLMGVSLAWTGEIPQGRTHIDKSVALYDPADRTLAATRLSAHASLSVRSHILWLLGYPDAALADAHQALDAAREADRAITLIGTLGWTSFLQGLCGNYLAGNALVNELIVLADETCSHLRGFGTSVQGLLFALTDEPSDAVRALASGLAHRRSTGATAAAPIFLSYLAGAYAELGQFNDAWRSIGEAVTMVEAAKEGWCEAEVNRVAGEIALKSPEPDAAKAETHFEHALSVSRQQQAKAWELRAAMSMARLWRDQGKRHEARELLAPVYGWFTEGFDTHDLKEAKALLDELIS
jgi:predicted ATPase